METPYAGYGVSILNGVDANVTKCRFLWRGGTIRGPLVSSERGLVRMMIAWIIWRGCGGVTRSRATRAVSMAAGPWGMEGGNAARVAIALR